MVLTVDAAPIDVIEMGSVLCDEEVSFFFKFLINLVTDFLSTCHFFQVCIDWPILKLAKVEEIWGDEKIVRKSKDEEIIVKDMKVGIVWNVLNDQFISSSIFDIFRFKRRVIID